MKLTLPTWLTLLRIVMIPVLVLVFYLPYTWTNFASAAIFGLAAITDWLDGWIARRYQLESAFGAFLDPVADKLMVAVALFLIGRVTDDRGWRSGRRSSSAVRSRCRRCANGWPSWASARRCAWR